MHQTEFTDPAGLSPESMETARLVREEIARRRISRQALADMARISLSTLEKALAGKRPFTLATLLRIEEALSVSLRPGSTAAQAVAGPSGGDVAPESLGAYARSAVTWLEGRYLTLCPSFGTPGGLFAYLTTIRWDVAKACLVFAESGRFEQAGQVSMPNLSGHIYLVTNEQGQYRLAMLSRPTIDGAMFGILTTLQVGHGSQLVPAATPLALRKLAEGEDIVLGTVTPEMAQFIPYREMLGRSIEDDFARLHLPS